MKATGIVRRIDDLGRVVIPKEIRRTLKIRESEPLEIFTDRNGEIILKKYSPIGEFSSGAQQLADAAAKTCGKLFCICDQEQVVAAAGPENKKYQGKSLSKAMEQRLFDRDFIPENNAYYPVTDDDAHTDQALVPVTRDGDPSRGRVFSRHEAHGSDFRSGCKGSRNDRPISDLHYEQLMIYNATTRRNTSIFCRRSASFYFCS